MKPALLVLAALTVLTGTALAADTGTGTSDVQALPPRPRIQDYSDQNRFISDVLAWQRLRDKLASEPHKPAPTPVHDPHDWHHVTGPENLDTALHNAEGYVQPHYKQKYRYNRTTHLSFPLPHLAPSQMASETAAPAADSPARRKDEMKSEMERLPEQVINQLDQLQLFTAQERQPGAIPDRVAHTN